MWNIRAHKRMENRTKSQRKTEKAGTIEVRSAETWVKIARDLQVRSRQEDDEESKILVQGECTRTD